MPENDHQPATRQDLAELKRDLQQQMSEVELHLAQRLERAETALLKGFQTFSKAQNTRVSALEIR